MNLTEWYPYTIHPIREGFYQTKIDDTKNIYYKYWNGQFWGVGENTLRNAVFQRTYNRARGIVPYKWRGLSQQ